MTSPPSTKSLYKRTSTRYKFVLVQQIYATRLIKKYHADNTMQKFSPLQLIPDLKIIRVP